MVLRYPHYHFYCMYMLPGALLPGLNEKHDYEISLAIFAFYSLAEISGAETRCEDVLLNTMLKTQLLNEMLINSPSRVTCNLHGVQHEYARTFHGVQELGHKWKSSNVTKDFIAPHLCTMPAKQSLRSFEISSKFFFFLTSVQVLLLDCQATTDAWLSTMDQASTT